LKNKVGPRRGKTDRRIEDEMGKRGQVLYAGRGEKGG